MAGSRHSAGLLMFRRREQLQVLLAHPGGPYWARRDAGAWTLPKGEVGDGEDLLAAACREFREETGFTPAAPYLPLGELTQKGGKRVTAWAFEAEADPAQLVCNRFEIEWPPRSGQMRSFAEIDRADWFNLQQAQLKILPAQLPFLSRLAALMIAP